MSNLYNERDGVFDVYGGSSIQPTIREAIGLAGVRGGDVTFEFNGVLVTVRGDSHEGLIHRDWERALNGYIEKRVGPYPPHSLTDAERAHDAGVEAKNIARREAAEAEYARQRQAREHSAANKLVNAAPLDLVSREAWDDWFNKQSDDYGRAVFTFAERWGRLMQIEIAEGRRIADIADRLCSEADIEGITGYMYGAAVAMLSKLWRHGEELRRWHNLKTQIGNEGERANENGGVLNPALLNLG